MNNTCIIYVKRDVQQQQRDIIIIRLLKELHLQLWLLYKKSTSATELKYQKDFKLLIQQVIFNKNKLVDENKFNNVLYIGTTLLDFFKDDEWRIHPDW